MVTLWPIILSCRPRPWNQTLNGRPQRGVGVRVGMFPEEVTVDMFVVVACFHQYSKDPDYYQHDNDEDLQVVE